MLDHDANAGALSLAEQRNRRPLYDLRSLRKTGHHFTCDHLETSEYGHDSGIEVSVMLAWYMMHRPYCTYLAAIPRFRALDDDALAQLGMYAENYVNDDGELQSPSMDPFGERDLERFERSFEDESDDDDDAGNTLLH